MSVRVRELATCDVGDGGAAVLSVSLLGGFALRADDTTIDLPADAERLVAFLALHPGRVTRTYVAGNLWLDGSQDRASGNLRSALWRLRKHATHLIDANAHTVAINPTTTIDVTTTIDTAERLCTTTTTTSNGSTHEPADLDIDPLRFARELLPGWYDEWTLIHRERLRQRCLHALEALANLQTTHHRYAAAIQSALAAINLDPLRESPHRCLIRTHLAEGNYSDALHHYDHYTTLLKTELGITPSPHMQQLLEIA